VLISGKHENLREKLIILFAKEEKKEHFEKSKNPLCEMYSY
jgi:hypothetical protein